jgi:branched-chain amino acid transport system substrate-binding protein
MPSLKLLAAASAFSLAVAPPAYAQTNEQFIPAAFYWVGPYAAGGSGIAAGFIDTLDLINTRDGGVGGVKLTWEKCETEYNNSRGVECYERLKVRHPAAYHPLSTGITYALLDRGGYRKNPPPAGGRGQAEGSAPPCLARGEEKTSPPCPGGMARVARRGGGSLPALMNSSG